MSLQLFELLDRLEILYPTNANLSDLRRLYIDKDMHSLFRLLASSPLTHEYNDNLRKLILEDNEWKLWPILNYYIDTSFVASFKSLHRLKIPYNKDCFSRGQLKSKRWLITKLEELDKELGTVFLCAGWYAVLAGMMFESNLKFDKIRSFDIDDNCHKIADTLNRKYVLDNWKFKASTLDICDMKYPLVYKTFRSNGSFLELTDMPDTIINTSCEHIVNFRNWFDAIPINTLVVLQTNNYFEMPEHVNCSKSLQDFSIITPLQKVLFEGELVLKHYNRYMRIGFK